MTHRAADAIARRLYDAGCRRAFGMPGGEVLTILDALRKVEIAFHLVKHENAGGFMAEGSYHMDGAPGILVATVGPGLMNAVNVVANAEQDRVPLIVLAGCIDPDEAATYTHQVLDHRAVLDPITKATFTLTAESAGVIVDKAVAIATEGRPGPVLIDVPVAVADMPAGALAPTRVPPKPVLPAPESLAETRSWLAEAERPVILAGLDVLTEGSETVVADFARRFQVPVITSYKAKGVLPEDDPLALGGAGLSPLADRTLVPFVQEADLVITAGYDPIEMRPGWRNPWDSTTQRVIDIHAAPNHHYMHQATVSFLAHTGATLTALGEGVEPRETWASGGLQKAQEALRVAFPETDPWGPAGAIAEARAVLPPETIATVDSGAHRILLSQMWCCPSPHTLLQSSGLCTMGCALPLAMGAKIATPERPVVAFTGDAGLLMVMGELSTAVEMELDLIVVVFVDASLGLIEMKQRQRQLANTGVDFARSDFAEIARGFGAHGVSVSDRAALSAALGDAQSRSGPVVIAVEIDRKAYDGRL